MPVNFHDVTQHHFEAGRRSYGPAKDLLVIGSIYLGQVRVVNSLEVDWNVLERLQDLDAPHFFKLVHKRCRKDSFASTMTQVDECAAWDVKGIVPRVGVIIFVCLLYPLEDLEERFKFNLAVGEVYVFETTFVPFTPTFRLR